MVGLWVGPLPTEIFKWLKEDKWDNIFKNQEGIGYFIKCDLEYPKELHDLHNDYSLAPEKLIAQKIGYHPSVNIWKKN